jgi:hypothetical protein
VADWVLNILPVAYCFLFRFRLRLAKLLSPSIMILHPNEKTQNFPSPPLGSPPGPLAGPVSLPEPVTQSLNHYDIIIMILTTRT